MADYIERIKDIHRRTIEFRNDPAVADMFAWPDAADCIQYAVGELAEASDAEMRGRLSHLRNAEKGHEMKHEIAMMVFMLCSSMKEFEFDSDPIAPDEYPMSQWVEGGMEARLFLSDIGCELSDASYFTLRDFPDDASYAVCRILLLVDYAMGDELTTCFNHCLDRIRERIENKREMLAK